MKNNGWIKMHRQLLDWGWYSDINVCRLWLHLLLTVNHEQQEWRGHTIKPGQKITSLGHLAAQTGLTIQNVRTAIDKLKSTGEITVKATSHYTLISIVKWGNYQDKINTPTNTPRNKQLTTNKNDKKLRSNNYTTVKPFFDKQKSGVTDSLKSIGQITPSFMVARATSGGERGELLKFFADHMRLPIPRIAAHLAHLRELRDLYYLKSICEKSDNFGKTFWGSIKQSA